MKKFILILLVLGLAGQVSAFPLFGSRSVPYNRYTVYINPGDDVTNMWPAATDTSFAICFGEGTYTMPTGLDIPENCEITSTSGWGLGAFLVSTDDSIFMVDGRTAPHFSFSNISLIFSGAGSWLITNRAAVATFTNVYGEIATWLVDSSADFRSFGCHWISTTYVPVKPVPTATSARGFVFADTASFDMKMGTRFGYDFGDRQRGLKSFGMEWCRGAKTSTSGGCQLSSDSGNTITADSSGGLYFDNCMFQVTASPLGTSAGYAVMITGGTSASANNINIENSKISGRVWGEGKSAILLRGCNPVSGDVRLGGIGPNIWANSSLGSVADTFTCVASDTVNIDNLDGIKSNGGVFCDSNKAVPYGNKPTEGKFVYVARGSGYTNWTTTARDLTINIPGISTTSTFVWSTWGKNTVSAAGADSVWAMVSLSDNTATIVRDQTSATSNSDIGYFYQK